MAESVRLVELRETFVFRTPLAEPEVNWTEKEYNIERIVTSDGDIIWYGLGTNWMKRNGETWTHLGIDSSIQPISGGVYPEGRCIWIPCDEPIYETLRREYYNKQHV